jgi:hypothetical protein
MIQIFSYGSLKDSAINSFIQYESKPALILKYEDEAIELALKRWFEELREKELTKRMIQYPVYLNVTYNNDKGVYNYLMVKEIVKNEYNICVGKMKFINAEEYFNDLSKKKNIQQTSLTEKSLKMSGIFPIGLEEILTGVVLNHQPLYISNTLDLQSIKVENYIVCIQVVNSEINPIINRLCNLITKHNTDDDTNYQIILDVSQNKNDLVYVQEILIRQNKKFAKKIVKRISIEEVGNSDSNVYNYRVKEVF